MFIISPDGYIRLPLALMRSTPLTHLISGLDEEIAPDAADGALATTITGYTEWVTEGSAPLTVGWDWQMTANGNDIRMDRVSEPRSNIMLVDAAQADLGPASTATLLGTVVDAFAWQDTTLAYIQQQRP